MSGSERGGLREDASVDVVAHEAPAKVHMLGAALEVPVLKQSDGTASTPTYT